MNPANVESIQVSFKLRSERVMTDEPGVNDVTTRDHRLAYIS